jgi:hypothetical protein
MRIDPYLPFILKTLETFPTLTAARLYAMVYERGYRGAVLGFDEGGVLRSMHVVKDSEYFMHAARIESVLPRDLLPQPMFPAPPSSSSGTDVPPPPPGSRYDTSPSP